MVPCAARALYCSTVSPAAAMRRAWNGVKIGPGPTAFTRMPSAKPPRQALDRDLTIAEQRGKLAIRGLSDRKENGTANHAEHAKGGSALEGQDDAFDLKARLAEVEQQAEMQACGFQIIQTLREMNRVDRHGYLQFDEGHVFDE
jgi:hypothetical protein